MPSEVPEEAAVSTAATVAAAVDSRPHLVDGGRRSRKKQQTRQRLVDAADELFATQGYEATTTTDVAEAADVAQRTLFRHFASKEALLYADMEDARLDLRDALAAAGGASSAIHTVIQALLSLEANFAEHRERRLLQARLAATSPAVSGYFRAVIQAGWEREMIVAISDRLAVDPLEDPRPEILAGAAMSACRAATRQWTASGGSEDYLGLLQRSLESIREIVDLRTAAAV
ncbi:MAG: TetR family transcriptional regulator [Actinomycetota bacterium]